MSSESLIKKFAEFSITAHPTTPSVYTENVLIIDGTNIFIRAYSAISSMNNDGANVGGIVGFLKTVGNFVKLYKFSAVICVFDGKGGSQVRRKIYKEYKENRKPMIKLNRTYDFLSPEQEEDSMKWQMIKLIEILKNLPITIFIIDRIEADDTISYLVDYIKNEKNGKSIIMSTDKDFLQLVSDEIAVWSPSKKIMYRIENIISEYQIHPNNFLLFRMLTGDDSDNISGIKGMGLKTIQKLFPEFLQEEKLTLDDLMILAAKYPKYKSAQNIIKSRDILELNKKLMDLSIPQLSTSDKILIMNKFDNPILVFNKAALTKIFIESKFIDAFPNAGEWLNNAFLSLLRFNIK